MRKLATFVLAPLLLLGCWSHETWKNESVLESFRKAEENLQSAGRNMRRICGDYGDSLQASDPSRGRIYRNCLNHADAVYAFLEAKKLELQQAEETDPENREPVPLSFFHELHDSLVALESEVRGSLCPSGGPEIFFSADSTTIREYYQHTPRVAQVALTSMHQSQLYTMLLYNGQCQP